MKIYSVSDKCAAFSTESGENAGIREAEKILRKLLDSKHLKQWKQIHFDVFAGNASTLFLAYPEPEIKITVAPYALPFIQEYFTE